MDRHHRAHAVVELAIRDLDHGAGLAHMPTKIFQGNAAWTVAATLAHNLRGTVTAARCVLPAKVVDVFRVLGLRRRGWLAATAFNPGVVPQQPDCHQRRDDTRQDVHRQHTYLAGSAQSSP